MIFVKNKSQFCKHNTIFTLCSGRKKHNNTIHNSTTHYKTNNNIHNYTTLCGETKSSTHLQKKRTYKSLHNFFLQNFINILPNCIESYRNCTNLYTQIQKLYKTIDNYTQLHHKYSKPK